MRAPAAVPALGSLSRPGATRLWSPQLLAVCGVRHFAEGVVKMWNEDRGFGFLSPSAGGEDVFVHRNSIQQGVQLSQGMAVSYDPEWDDKKRKDRAANVRVAAGGEGGGAAAAPAPGAGQGGPAAAARPMPSASCYNLVGSVGKWEISRQPMGQDPSGAVVRHRITVRSDAPGGADLKKEEFQIVGDGSWDKRIYPAGPDREETVVLRPGSPGSRAAGDRGKGHGRNWAVEGRAGSSIDIVYDPQTQMVTAEQA